MINSFGDAITGYFHRYFYLFIPLQVGAHMHFPGSQLPGSDISRSFFLKNFIREILEEFRYFLSSQYEESAESSGKGPFDIQFFSRVQESV